jgi:hypothetical protein
VAAAIYPVTQPTTLDEYEAAIDRIAAEGVEPARSAALDTLSRQIRSSAWQRHCRQRADDLASRADAVIDRDQDLLAGLDALVADRAVVL